LNEILIIAPTEEVRVKLHKLASKIHVSVNPVDSYDVGIDKVSHDPPTLVIAEDSAEQKEKLLDLTKALKAPAPVTPLIVYMQKRDAEAALVNMHQGAYDCVCEPVSTADIMAVAKHAMQDVGRKFLPVETKKPLTQKQRRLIYAGCLGVLLLVVLGFVMFKRSIPYKTFRLASSYPTALSWHNDDLWITDWHGQSIFRYRIHEGLVSIVDVFNFEDFQPISIAVSDDYVFTISGDGFIRRHRKDSKLTLDRIIAAPGKAPTGLAWDGKNLWSCDAEEHKVYLHDVYLKVKKHFEIPANNPVGIVWTGKTLWVADGKERVVWKLDARREPPRVFGPYYLKIFKKKKNLKLSGFTAYEGDIWLVSENFGLLVKHVYPKSRIKDYGE